MSKTIINLSYSAVDAATAQILEHYPQHPHQYLFAEPSVRQKLLVHVLSRMPAHYAVVNEDDNELPITIDCSMLTEAEQQLIQQLIHEGIQLLAAQHPHGGDSSPSVPESAPSHWFG